MKYLVIFMLVFLSSAYASEDASKNYFKLGGIYGEYKGNDIVLPQNLKGFGVNYGFGHYFGPLALEVSHKVLSTKSGNDDYTYSAFSFGPRLSLNNISLLGGVSLSSVADHDYMVLYYAGIGGELKVLGVFGIFADLTYTFSKIKATEFTSGLKVYF